VHGGWWPGWQWCECAGGLILKRSQLSGMVDLLQIACLATCPPDLSFCVLCSCFRFLCSGSWARGWQRPSALSPSVFWVLCVLGTAGMSCTPPFGLRPAYLGIVAPGTRQCVQGTASWNSLRHHTCLLLCLQAPPVLRALQLQPHMRARLSVIPPGSLHVTARAPSPVQLAQPPHAAVRQQQQQQQQDLPTIALHQIAGGGGRGEGASSSASDAATAARQQVQQQQRVQLEQSLCQQLGGGSMLQVRARPCAFARGSLVFPRRCGSAVGNAA